MAGRNGASQLHGGFAAAVPVQATSGTNAYARLFDRHSRRRAPLSHAGILKPTGSSGNLEKYEVLPMTALPDFFRLVVDSITEHIAVIDREGIIQFVNRAWLNFAQDNNSRRRKGWSGVNYLNVCDKAAATVEEGGKAAAEGIRKVVDRTLASFHFEMPWENGRETSLRDMAGKNSP